MKVKELLKELRKEDQEAELYLSSDSEGNAILHVDELVMLDGHLVIYPTDEFIEYDDPISEEEYQKWLKEQALKGQVGYYKEQLEEDRRQGKATI